MFTSRILLTSVLLLSASCKLKKSNDNAEVNAIKASSVIDAVSQVYRKAGDDALKLQSKMWKADGYVDGSVYKKLMREKAENLNKVVKKKMGSFKDLLHNEKIKRAQDVTTSGVNFHHTNGDAARGIVIDLRTGLPAAPDTVITEANAQFFAYRINIQPVQLHTVVRKRGVTQVNMRKFFQQRKLPDGTMIFSSKHLSENFPKYVDDLELQISKMKPGKERDKAAKALAKYRGFEKQYGKELAWKGLKVEVGYVMTPEGVDLFTSTDAYKTEMAYLIGIRDQHTMASQAALQRQNGGKIVSTAEARVEGAGEFMTDFNVVNGKPELMTMEYAVDVADPDNATKTRNVYLSFIENNNKTGHHQSFTETVKTTSGETIISGAAYFNCANWSKTNLLNQAFDMSLTFKLFDEGTKKVYPVTYSNCATIHKQLLK